MMVKLATQQIGRCGELLVQYRLLKYGIESAPLTTDPGIDLVAYSSIRGKPLTIQVKTSRHLSYFGKKRLLWQIPENCPADYIAIVDFERDKCWLIGTEEFKQRAHHTPNDKRKLQWVFSDREPERLESKEEEFKEYKMGNAIPKVLELE